MQEEQFIINEEHNGMRIDLFLSKQLENVSRSYIQKLIKEKEISVNGVPVKANYKVNIDDVVKMIIPDLSEPDILPENIPLDILYEDDDILIVNKPKGMVVHPCPSHYNGTLVNALMYYCKNDLSGINGVMRPGIVHRIDMDLSLIHISEPTRPS